MVDSSNLTILDNVESLNVFSMQEFQSQGDNCLQFADSYFTSANPSGNPEKNCPSTFNLEDFNFLETVTVNDDLNMDGQAEIAGDPLNISSFDEINCDFTNILTNEQSFDLNSISDLVDISSFCNIPVLDSLNETIENSSLNTGSESTEAESSSELAGKYKEMRRKNNLASQRSRKIRKVKDSEMADKLKKLEKENKDLLLLSEKLEKERDLLKDYLLTIMSKKS